jgi:hypothetical protein
MTVRDAVRNEPPERLHWIEERESLAPWADGEWGPQTDTGPGVHQAGRVSRELPGSSHNDGSRDA